MKALNIWFVNSHVETVFCYRRWFTSSNNRLLKWIYPEFLQCTSPVNNYNNFCGFSITVLNEQERSHGGVSLASVGD